MSFAHNAARASETALCFDVKNVACEQAFVGGGVLMRHKIKKKKRKINGMSKRGKRSVKGKAWNGKVNDHAREREEKEV